MFILIDCDNFFVSCERIFQPRLRNRPVVVLSNNDGCVVARSPEAKAVGIAMCSPFFKIENLWKATESKENQSNHFLSHIKRLVFSLFQPDPLISSLLFPILAFILLYSILPHKELRFILIIVPAINACAAGIFLFSLIHFSRFVSRLGALFAVVVEEFAPCRLWNRYVMLRMRSKA